MAINQQARINFQDLARFTWKANDHFGLFQTYVENAIKELIASGRSSGVLYGGAITVNSGLAVNIAKGLCLFSNGQIVAWDDQLLTMSAADPSNPRYDRIELVYSQANNISVTNIDNQTKQLDKLLVATPTKNPGTAAGSPIIPTKTVGTVSLGVIKITAALTSITSSLIDQSDYAMEVARPAIQTERTTSILNGQGSVIDIQHLRFDKTKSKQIKIWVDMYRKDNAEERAAWGHIWLRYLPVSDSWSIVEDLHVSAPNNASNPGEFGVNFSMSGTVAGQLQYISDNMAGGSYISAMTFKVDSIA